MSASRAARIRDWTDNMGIKWENPAPQSKGQSLYDWEAIAEYLKSNPGKWALIDDDAPRSMPGQIKRGVYAHLRPIEEWETTSRANDKGKKNRGKVYLRYVGP